MLINANVDNLRFSLLSDEYLKLLNTGVKAENILVLVQNSKKKNEWHKKIKENSKIGNIGNLKIYSFFGLCYNYILDNWAIVENSIKDTSNSKIIPNLCGLEVSQYIFKECIDEVDFSGYNSKTSLLHQLLRRNSLICLNNLNQTEVDKRSEILKEAFSIEANQAIKKYKLKTIDLRAFDYIRQMNLFEFLYKKLENKFQYVFLDDGDEITPAIFSYLEYIKPTVKDFYIAYDSFGSSRLGYLGAVNIDFEKFLNTQAKTIQQLEEKQKHIQNIFNKVQNNELMEFENIKTKTFLKRSEMLNDIIFEIKHLLNNGIKQNEISIITPISDEFLKMSLERTGYNFNFLTKNEKLNQNKLIGYILELLKIINDTNNSDISLYVLKGIFIELLKLDYKETIKLLQEYKLEREMNGINLFDLIKRKDKEEFKKIIEIYEKIHFEKLSSQLYEIVSNYIVLEEKNSKDIIKINQLLKQIYDFEDIFDNVSNDKLITQLENTIISENPLSDDEINENSIIVSSAQKIIDYSIKTKYQFLIDTSNENWLKQDIGPLYNAWVMQKKWKKDSFELSDNINLTKDRTARILYKLYNLTDNQILYSSIYDSLGIENYSGIDIYYEFKNEDTKNNTIKPIVPRKDQQAVLDYKGGKMSVSATAGSGKTTIMLLLVDKILNGEILSDIEAKNIFVLTFMESAARNFKERIKAKYPDLKELPNISTIHGLALRIIKENNNYLKVGLDNDFEIIDEIKRTAIINDITYSCGVSQDKANLYDTMISSYKNELAQDENYQTTNNLFLKIYNSYQLKLKEQNLVDYDDLLLLSLKLLRKNDDILNYYQNIVKIIIEDEAQDSSYIQQNLITLLAGKYNNIIRCGDINQAITSTFTNSDVNGFKDFIKNSQNVVMDRCQRCATGVLDCANNIVKYANNKKINAFCDLMMKPVENINIIDKNAVENEIFEEEKKEEEFILNKIRQILKNDNNATIGVLLRSNFAIEKWDKLFKKNSFKTYKNQDCLINNSVYKVVLMVLEYILNPYDLILLKELTKTMFELGLYDFKTLNYIQSLKQPLFLEDNLDEQIFWDLNYFLYKNHYSIYNLAYEIGEFYFSKTKNADNISLVATIAQKIFNTQKTYEATVFRMREIQYKNSFSNIKFYSCDDNAKKASTIQLMTLHKSKGDEFDYVFIPEMTQENLCLNPTELKLKENTKFVQKIKKNPKSDIELKNDIVEENYRLIYVGITRAKKKLYISTSCNYKFFNKNKKYKNSEIFEGLEKIC